MKTITIVTAALVFLFAGEGCFNDIEEVPLVIPEGEAPPPQHLSAQVTDGKVTLAWEPVTGASGYRVYRSVDVAEDQRPLASTKDTFYVDTEVQNGRKYFYAVSTIDAHSLEGDRSSDVTASPALYAVMINGGDEYTGSRTVALALTAPATTALMMLSNEASLSGGKWESFAAARLWALEGSDGAKGVYARFRDVSGGESPIVGDTITLDSYARITAIVIQSILPAYRPGSTVHFRLNVEDNETGGEALIGFDGFDNVATLTDDGRGGDETAADGVYEADYTFPSTMRGLDIVAIGSFTDRAGNVAPPFEMETRISFTDPPEPVALIGVADSSTAGITIRWVASQDENFRSYRIYRDVKSGVVENPALLVRELPNIAQTSYPDGGLKEGVRYYYRIFVVNDLYETAGSNELSAHTYDAYPDAVVLDDPSSVGNGRATLTWSTNQNTDFKEYRVYRAIQPGVTTTSQLMTTITERQRTYFDDAGLDLVNNTYYYKVFVFDVGGKYSRSNEVDTAQP